jgi:unsaturated chondroitin disaccharide hydrolase
MCWLAHRITRDSGFRSSASSHTTRLSSRSEDDTVFKGFPFYYGAAAGWLVCADREARDVALAGARGLARMFKPELGLIPLGTSAEEGSSIGSAESSIDSLEAAPFMLWAGRESGDVQLEQVGAAHARRVIELHLRSDGSFVQSSSLDPETGRLRHHYTHKGYSDSSTWGRAQAWGTLFSLRAGHREAAVRGAEWWLAHVPDDRVSFWDFDDPAIPNTEKDATATAIVGNALLKLGGPFREAGEATISALVEGYLSAGGGLTRCCFNKRADSRPEDAASSCEFVVGDYYLFESLLVLAGEIPADLL